VTLREALIAHLRIRRDGWPEGVHMTTFGVDFILQHRQEKLSSKWKPTPDDCCATDWRSAD
jgi:hypothetical protein